MCGIAGIVHPKLPRDAVEQVLRGFQTSLHHRGPDDTGSYLSPDASAGLVNTRLAILDLSPAGHQPMSSEDGRYHIVFNGEIYNFAELKSDLEKEGEVFHSNCDTEVILKLFRRDGPDCVRELAGMFAFAIWDTRDRQFFLARGPLGIKPLYYWADGDTLLFASELRTLLNSGIVPRKLSSDGVRGYLLFGAVQEPLTLVEGVRSLPAGHYLTLQDGVSRTTKFWDLQFGSERTDDHAAVAKARSALEESVARHLVSDVPVGIFLSGGIDSTAVLALARAQTGGGDLRTFSISFADPEYNEGDVAARTAKHFGATHTDWRMDSTTGKGLLEMFLERSDQPSIDGFNTFCVSKLAHDHGLKVVLSGLGGDEVFGGYESFKLVPQIVRKSRSLNPLRPMLAAVGDQLQTTRVPARIRRLGVFLREAPITSTAYWAMRGIFTPREVAQLLPRYCAGEQHVPPLGSFVPPQPTLEDEVSYLEITRYMRNQLLRDSDVMSMAWGLELRVPFVDSRMIDAVRAIPAPLRLARGKKLLLDAVPEIPEWVRNRRKQGFTFPFGDWISGEWGELFEKLDQDAPVPLESWYRRWCLFALDRFVQRHQLS